MSRDDGKIWLKMEISWEYTTHTLTNTCDALVCRGVPPISSGGLHGPEAKWFHSHHVFFQQGFFAGALAKRSVAGWVAGGCWDDDITNVMDWIIPEHSLLSY